MKIEWECPDSWTCWSCGSRKCKVLSISENWLDVECINCEQEDAMLLVGFNECIKREVKNDRERSD